MDKNINSSESYEELDKFLQMEMQDFSNNNNNTSANSIDDNNPMFLNNNISKDKNSFFKADNNSSVYIEFSNVIKYYFNKIKEIIKKNKSKEIFAFILSISGIILYIIGLIGCYGDQVHCLSIVKRSFYIRIIVSNIISCICLCILLVLITLRKISFFHLFYLSPCFIILMCSDQGTSLAHHGYYNCLGFIVLLLIIYSISSFIYLIIKLIWNKKYRIYIPIFIILFILIICFEIYINKNTKCEDWDIGLNNTRIYNNEDEYACQIKLPKSCYINIYDGKLNVTKILNVQCNKRDDKEKRLLFEYIKKSKNPYIKYNAKRIGYSLLNKGDFSDDKQDGMIKLARKALYNFVDMDNLPPHFAPDKIPEAYVDFTDYPDDPNSKYGKIHFNLKKNETLVNERKKNAEKNKVLFNNIFAIFIDTLSRAHINRKMPKLKQWLEKYMKYDSDDFMNYQFFKFHSLGAHTLHNLKPIIFGESILSPNGINIINFMKDKGYITAQTNNYCGTQPYQIHPSFDNSNVTFGEFDHELISLFCEPNYYIPGNPISISRGNTAIFRRCLYGYDSFHHLFNYSKLFWRTYKDNRRYMRLSIMDSHEVTGELISLIDQPLVDFLDDLYKNGDLKDTALFMFSDHGNHLSPHLSLMPSDDLEIEKIMPFFSILLPKKNEDYQNELFLDEFYENLYKNQQSLVTCYDIHDTIIHIIFNEGDPNKAPYTKNGISLFNLVNNKNRTCDNYPEIIKKRSPGTLTCNCYKY